MNLTEGSHLLQSICTVARLHSRTKTPCRNARSFFECFPYVCPDPVLVKKYDFDNKSGAKDAFPYRSNAGLFADLISRHAVVRIQPLCVPVVDVVVLLGGAARPPRTEISIPEARRIRVSERLLTGGWRQEGGSYLLAAETESNSNSGALV